MSKALRRLAFAIFGVFAVAAVVAMAHTGAASTEVNEASKHWVDKIRSVGQLD